MLGRRGGVLAMHWRRTDVEVLLLDLVRGGARVHSVRPRSIQLRQWTLPVHRQLETVGIKNQIKIGDRSFTVPPQRAPRGKVEPANRLTVRQPAEFLWELGVNIAVSVVSLVAE